jgi:hypothetical protein
VHDRPTTPHLRRDHRQLRFEGGQLLPAHGPLPDPAPQLLDRPRRLRFKQDLAAVDDRHAAAQFLDVLDDVR